MQNDGKKIKIAHIINPVKVGLESDLYVAQPITFETMKVAKDFSGALTDVLLLSCQYAEDNSYVPDCFLKTKNLERSVLDIGNFVVKRKFPILEDILKRAYEECDCDYIIYTNVDIAVMPFFYNTVRTIIDKGYDAFVINKRIIPSIYSKIEELSMMYAEFGMPHPGFDCFVFKKELFPKFNIGDVCIGIPNVDYAFIANLVAFSEKFGLFEDLHVTFHIGDERSTNVNKYKDYHNHNWREVVNVYKSLEKGGFFSAKPLLNDLWLQFNGKKRMWKKLYQGEVLNMKLNCKNNDEAAYILSKLFEDKKNKQAYLKDKVAFVDFSWRKKTKSSQFFLEILQEKYNVDIFWDETLTENGNRFDINAINNGEYAGIVFWQVMPRQEEINLLRNKNIIIIPMYDSVYELSEINWLSYKNFKMINFSKTLHRKLVDLGLNSLYLKYFCKPPEEIKNFYEGNKLKGFFWQRIDEIDFNLIKKLIGQNSFEKIYFHNAPDPTRKKKIDLRPDDIKKYNIKSTDWFENSKDYFNCLNDADVFFSPRLYEGIGLASVEALCLGKLVVAPDTPVLNEYIKNGFNGILYDIKNPKPVSFENIKSVRKNTLEYCKEGYKEWVNSKELIFDFIEKKRLNSVADWQYETLLSRIRLLKQNFF